MTIKRDKRIAFLKIRIELLEKQMMKVSQKLYNYNLELSKIKYKKIVKRKNIIGE